MPTLILMQGPSGGGKSTKAKELAPQYNAEICSTDDYFVNCQTGEYKFRPEKLSQYHQQNQDKAAALLKVGTSVIVDNTNLQNWQVRPYVQAAKEVGAEIIIVRCDGEYQNVHGVPADRVQAMREQMEDLDPEKALTAKAPWEV